LLVNEIYKRLRRKIGTALLDLRYGALLKGNIETSNAHLGARGTENSGYDVLSVLFHDRIRAGEVLVDVGCGKGRVLNWWLKKCASHKMYGIELDAAVAERTRNRLKAHRAVTILTGDACNLLPAEGSLFYLFNPFDQEVMKRFATEMIKAPRASTGLMRRIIYFNCQFSTVFENNENWLVENICLHGLSPHKAIFVTHVEA
jgi:SAM-dependent methyltransferase